MTAADLLERRLDVQMEMEAMFPAAIEIAGLTSAPVAAAGGNLRTNAPTLIGGGLLGDYDLVFRVRKELLAGVPAAV